MPVQFYAGAARIKLDPPIGIAMAGYGRRIGRSAGVHDDLAAQAIVVSDGRTKATIVSVDVLALGDRICDAIAAQVAAQTSISPEALMICATHTHSGPSFNIFATPRDGAATTDRDIKWEQSLPDKIARAVIEADKTLRPAIVAAGAGKFALGTNRRLLRADGSIQLAPNYAGATEADLNVMGLYEATPQKEPIAFLINYPSHGVILCEDNLLYSRDWPGFAVDAVERIANGTNRHKPAIALFVQGACGNIDPRHRGSFEIAEREGNLAGKAAIEALAVEKAGEASGVVARRIPLRLRLRDLSRRREIAQANLRQTAAALENHGGAGGYHEKRLKDQHQRSIEELSAVQALEDANRRDRRVNQATQELRTHMTLVAMGDIALVGIPGELFVELGQTIKSNSYFKNTFVLGYCNDLAGYFPTREAYELGGYEVDTSRVAEGSGELMVETALATLAEMRRTATELGSGQS